MLLFPIPRHRRLHRIVGGVRALRMVAALSSGVPWVLASGVVLAAFLADGRRPSISVATAMAPATTEALVGNSQHIE
jgi:hypothetical protein